MKFLPHKILSFLLVLSVMWLFYNASVNWHYHIMPNGHITIHSHIYTPGVHNAAHKTPIESHKHSNFEYMVLAQVFFMAIIVFLFVALLNILLNSSYKQYAKIRQNFVFNSAIHHLLLRGPPLSM